jgi:lysophospholipid acyltransferase (LPLAT)-like uncharacterized protein
MDEALRGSDPVILAAWHQDVVPLFHYVILRAAGVRRGRFAMLASRSFDGELTERLLAHWGFRFHRGSAGKEGGTTALLGLSRSLQEGRSAVVIADGPQPPPCVFRPGPIFLARESGVPLYVARAWARPQLVVPRTWFKMAVPLPRCEIAVFSAGPIDVSGDVEEARLRAEAALNRLCVEADAHLYARPRVEGGVALARASL